MSSHHHTLHQGSRNFQCGFQQNFC
jgi:hypothetical protein